MQTLRIATRKSALALWQAEYVKAALEKNFPELRVELLPLSSRGDKILDVPLAKVGGKGLFVKELEQALVEGEADLAVHSMKDVPMDFPAGLCLAAICEREDPRDAFVSKRYPDLASLPQHAVVGTSSLRRQAQLLALRPDLEIAFLRGNVNTRLAKLDAGEFDAIILAAAGLKRLGFTDRIASYLSTEQSLPAGGQGAVGIECRADDEKLIAILQTLHHGPTALCVSAERALNKRLQGGCQVPIASFAEVNATEVSLRALVADIDGSEILRSQGSAATEHAEALGIRLAEELLAQGAGRILNAVYGGDPVL